ncbi:MAG: Asp23/Gls24 family envelope stress response protein [Clostridia bacterium]|nr:Asp23/Gls24 family envelope stress response protein [Clostridia bacterium]
MDENTVYTEGGVVKISEDVVQSITAMAVNEVNGVILTAGLADGIVEKVEKLVSVKKNYSKNVRVDINEKNVSIDIHVLVDYGIKIQPLAAELQEVIKHNIETMTDLNIVAVNVYVDGVHFVKEPKKAEEPKEKDKN